MFRPHFCDWHHSTVSTSSHFCMVVKFKELDIFTLRELYVGQTGRIVFPYLLKYATYLHYIDHFSLFLFHAFYMMLVWAMSASGHNHRPNCPFPSSSQKLSSTHGTYKEISISHSLIYIDTLCKFCPCASLSLRHKHYSQDSLKRPGNKQSHRTVLLT